MRPKPRESPNSRTIIFGDNLFSPPKRGWKEGVSREMELEIQPLVVFIQECLNQGGKHEHQKKRSAKKTRHHNLR